VYDRQGKPLANVPVQFRLDEPKFRFGVFEGGPHRADPFKTARQAGFTMATVLPAWGWTTGSGTQPSWNALDRILGFSSLRNMGFYVKAHGVLWLQEYGILPEDKKSLAPEDFLAAAREHYQTLLAVWGDRIDLWEVMNEPATVNVIHLPRDRVIELIRDIGTRVHEQTRKPTLINSPHESDYGRKFTCFTPSGAPVDDYPLTYSAFLQVLKEQNVLDVIDIIGLQFYSGARYNTELGGHTGPAFTLGWFVDTVERYTAFGKPIHITEMSVPSAVDDDTAQLAFWREPWTRQTQADYAEAVFTLAYSMPVIGSITYWDVTDTKPSVRHGGLIAKDGTPKPAFQRLQDCIRRWTEISDRHSDDKGTITAALPAGKYRIMAIVSKDRKIETDAEIAGGATVEVILREE